MNPRFQRVSATLSWVVLGAASAHGLPQSPCSAGLIHDAPGEVDMALSAAFDGTNFLVGYAEDTPDTAVGCRLVSPSGSIGPAIATGLNGSIPVVAYGAGRFLLVGGDPTGDDVWAQFVSPSGVPGMVVPITAGAAEAGPVAAVSDGTNFLVVYFRNDLTGSGQLYARRLASDGTLLGSELAISSGPIEDRVANGAAFDGVNYFITWMEPLAGELRGRFVSTGGALGSAFTLRSMPPSSEAAFPAVAFDGASYLVAWAERTGPAANDIDVLAQRRGPTGTALGPVFAITAAPRTQAYPFVAWDAASARYCVTWTDLGQDVDGDLVCDGGEGTCADVRGRFLGANGVPLGAEFVIQGGAGDQESSNVVSGAGTWLVTWSEGNLLLPQPGGTNGVWAATLPSGGCPAMVPFCFGTGLGFLCPCGNGGAAGRGCANSTNVAGALLAATGTPSADDVVLQGSGMPATSACIYLHGDMTLLPPVSFGDGLRCTGGTLLRLRVRTNAGGASAFPNSTDTVTLAQRGGVVPGSGALRAYQTYYRNAAAAFCPPETFNVTNGVTITW